MLEKIFGIKKRSPEKEIKKVKKIKERIESEGILDEEWLMKNLTSIKEIEKIKYNSYIGISDWKVIFKDGDFKYTDNQIELCNEIINRLEKGQI